MLDIFEALKKYAKSNNFKQIIYKAIPYIYHQYPAQEDLYALFRSNSKLYRRDISTTILLTNKIPYSTLRKRQIKKAKKNEIIIQETDAYQNFWEILTDVLKTKHNKLPVHSFSEIIKLHKKLPKNIKLYGAFNNKNELIAGCVLYFSYPVIHIQYMASKIEHRQLGGLDLIIDHIIDLFSNKYQYLDFGNSNENEGKYLNEGLIFQKEGFGGRGITYDFYKIEL